MENALFPFSFHLDFCICKSNWSDTHSHKHDNVGNILQCLIDFGE